MRSHVHAFIIHAYVHSDPKPTHKTYASRGTQWLPRSARLTVHGCHSDEPSSWCHREEACTLLAKASRVHSAMLCVGMQCETWEMRKREKRKAKDRLRARGTVLVSGINHPTHGNVDSCIQRTCATQKCGHRNTAMGKSLAPNPALQSLNPRLANRRHPLPPSVMYACAYMRK